MENVDVEIREIQLRRVANGIVVEPVIPPSQRGMVTVPGSDVFVFNSFEELIIWLRSNMVMEKSRLEKQNGQR